MKRGTHLVGKMSVREGTRRKKISVLHMLGTWEGKIEGCNCPSCKEWDAREKTQGAVHKSPAKTTKSTKPIAKKVSIKVKTTKVMVEKEDPALLEKKITPKQQTFMKNVSSVKGVKIEPGLTKLPLNSRNSECSFTSEVIDSKIDGGKYMKGISVDNMHCEKKNVDLLPGVCNSVSSGVDMFMDRIEKVGESCHSQSVENTGCSDKRGSRGALEAVTESLDRPDKNLKRGYDDGGGGQKVGDRQKLIREETILVDPQQIKQEPEEYFSDEEDLGRYGRPCVDTIKSESRMSKRARMVTSEIENIYAKPRMVFTGRGVVRKFEPGIDKTPKSRRGRKPNKVIPVKVKQEPKDHVDTGEDEERCELDQLQRALSEAAAGISDVGDFADDLHDFGDAKEGKQKRKAPKIFKRVESDGDKYVECSMCFKMLKESSMKQHYKTHTGEKPHTCDECDARFTRKGDVERHKRLVHKNQKPFKCRKCSREFSDRKNLKSHLQNHDKAIYFACDTCGFKFGKREYYENHIRYIHPLPNGQIPVFAEGEEDLASKQLKELEMEETKEKERERERAALNENLHLDNIDEEEEEEEEDEDEEDKAMEITVTEGEELNATSNRKINIKKEELTDTDENVNTREEDDDFGSPYPPIDATKNCKKEISVDSTGSLRGPQVGTDVRVSKGTLSFTQTVPDTDTQDEELVNKVIAAAVSQAANTIESLQTAAGANLSGNEINDFDDDDDDEEDEEEDEEEEEELMEETDAIQEILDSPNFDLVPMPQVQKPADQQTEIHINASVGGQKKKFIIQVPPGSNFNVQTPDGMEMIVTMVNQLCPGKGELDGPVEVVMHNTNLRTVGLE